MRALHRFWGVFTHVLSRMIHFYPLTPRMCQLGVRNVGSMGISTVWVNRRHDKTGFGATQPATGEPDLEVPDLKTLVEMISFPAASE